MRLIQQLAGIQGGGNTDIDLLGASVTAGPDGTDVRDINLVVPAIGTLTGAGTISPKHALDFRMHATLHTSGGVLTALGQQGDTGVPFMIQGTSENPAFKADMKGMAGQIAKDPSKAVNAAKGILSLFK
jgi:AsmA protein